MSRWVLIVLLASVPCFAEPTTKESKVVMDLRAEIEKLRKEVATLRAELAKIRAKPETTTVTRGMGVEEAKRVLEADGWELSYESARMQSWRKEDGEWVLGATVWVKGGLVDEVNRSRTKR